MTPAFESSHFLLALVMGAGAAIGFIHLWLWQQSRREPCHLWIAAFCATSIVFQAARYLEVQAATPAAAIEAGRLQVASVPLIIFSLLAFARSLHGPSWRPRHYVPFVVLTLLLSWLGLFTEFMTADRTFEDVDWFGHRHASAEGALGILTLVAYAIPAYAYLVYEVRRSPRITTLEKRVVIVSVAGFATIGILTILSALSVVSFPASAHYGPLLIAGGLSFLLVHQHGRMQKELEKVAARGERRLQVSDARYRQLVDSAPVGIAALDARGRLLVINRHLCGILGLPLDILERPGMERLSILDVQSVREAGIAEALGECLETAQPIAGEFVVALPSGARKTLHLDLAAVRDLEGRGAGVQAIVEDVGERKRLEEKLRQSQKMDAVGGLAAGIAHEINNPMSYVFSNLRMLRDEWNELMELTKDRVGDVHARLAGCEELIDDSIEGVDRAVTIVREVNDFSYSRGDNQHEIDLNELMEESLRLAEPEIGGGIEVVRRYAELPPVLGSRGQICQVFLNLIVNAAHAMQGRGRLCLESAAIDQGREVAARVIDDGPGIEPDLVDRVFDPFFTTKPAGKGTGLGLYICYEIARIHEGSLQVKAAPGEGATFELHLPTNRTS